MQRFTRLATLSVGSRWVRRAAVVAAVVLALCHDAPAQRQSGKVVEQAEYTAPYDAFMKMNRIPEAPAKGESIDDYYDAVRIRLENQAGRRLLKRPAKDFSEDDFVGWLAFVRTYGDKTGVGNCIACHAPADFTDHTPHDLGLAAPPVKTPSLRNLKKKAYLSDHSAKTIEQAIRAHFPQAKVSSGKKVDQELTKIVLTDTEIRRVAGFVASLQSVDRDAFRAHLVNVVVQPLDFDDF